MVGHYVNNLMPCEEDRLLTFPVGEVRTAMYFGGVVEFSKRPGCVMQVAAGDPWAGLEHDHSTIRDEQMIDKIGDAYDALLRRFGVLRINDAIRSRILSNRARRTLQNRPVEAAVSR